MYLLDFDDNHTWAPRLAAALTDVVPQDLVKELVAATPEYIEDACELLLAGANAKRLIGKSITWVQSNEVAAYHGRVRLFFIGDRGVHGLLRGAWQDLLDPSKAG